MKRLLVSIGILVIFPLLSPAQTERGTIRGTVIDQSGGSVGGANVVAVNTGTGVKNATISTESGNYTIANLPPGQYSVEVEHPGFKKLVRENVRVDVAGVIGLDLPLQVGEVTDRVTVEAAAPLLKSESSDV